MLVSLHTPTAKQSTTTTQSLDTRTRMHTASLADADVHSTGKQIFSMKEISVLKIPSNEEDCVDDADVPIYEGPIGEIGKEPQFDASKPKWYHCETMGL